MEGVREAGGDARFPEHVSVPSDCTQPGHDAGLVSGAETRSGVRLVGGSGRVYANASWQRRLFPSAARAQTHTRAHEGTHAQTDAVSSPSSPHSALTFRNLVPTLAKGSCEW